MTPALTRLVSSREGANMSTRPEYYSGRGVTESDLNARQLATIYRGLLHGEGTDFPKGAAENFLLMVKNLSYLTASDFLTALYALDARNYTIVPEDAHQAVHIGPDDETRVPAAMAGMFSFLGNKRSDEEEKMRSNGIKYTFLRAVGKNDGHAWTHHYGGYR